MLFWLRCLPEIWLEMSFLFSAPLVEDLETYQSLQQQRPLLSAAQHRCYFLLQRTITCLLNYYRFKQDLDFINPSVFPNPLVIGRNKSRKARLWISQSSINLSRKTSTFPSLSIRRNKPSLAGTCPRKWCENRPWGPVTFQALIGRTRQSGQSEFVSTSSFLKVGNILCLCLSFWNIGVSCCELVRDIFIISLWDL